MFLLVTALSLSAPPISIPPLNIAQANGSYTATFANFPSPMLPLIEAEVAIRATAMCGDKQVDWGNFSFNEERPDQPSAALGTIEDYRRNFRCIPAKVVVFDPAPADWKPSTADEADVRRIFHEYYAERDAGAIDAALAMFDPSVVTEREELAKRIAAENAGRGRGTRRITGVTWYVNPAQAPRAGIFAAIDFVGDHPAMDFYCGYVVLWRRGLGDYQITREEQNQHAKSEGPDDAQRAAQIRTAMCRGT